MSDSTDLGQAIVASARTCVGTRFHFNHRERGVALDCVGLLRHVAGECGLYAPPDVDYTVRNCFGRRVYLDARVGMDEIRLDDVQPGHVLLLWMSRPDRPQHMGIYAGDTLIHANSETKHVREDPMYHWRDKVVGVFALRRTPEAAHILEEDPNVGNRRSSPKHSLGSGSDRRLGGELGAGPQSHGQRSPGPGLKTSPNG